jgi:hypothetical protein
MLPDGHRAGALTRERAMAPVHDALASQQDRERYRQAVDKHQAVREVLDV